MTITFAVGDIHGCLPQLKILLGLCCSNPLSHSAKFVFVGDYIDRGPDSRGVVEFLMELQLQKPGRVICLKGNHEQMLLSALDNEADATRWIKYGGQETLDSYKCMAPHKIPEPHVSWLRSLSVWHDDGLRWFVHAGANPKKTLSEQDHDDCLWIREPFLSSKKDWGRLIVHGHTPTSDGAPDLRPIRLNIDTGAIFGGPLTAAVFDDSSRAPVAYILD